MQHKKIKTQPNLSTEILFMRKPSRQFLKSVIVNRNKLKEQLKTQDCQDNFLSQRHIAIGFISAINKKIVASNDNKPKKNTIQLSRFRIKHENLLLRTQNEQLKKNNIELQKYNKQLLLEVQNLQIQLQKQILSQSKISLFSQQATTASLNKTLDIQNDSKPKSFQLLQLNYHNLVKSEQNIISSLTLPIHQKIQNNILSERIEFLEKELQRSLDIINSLQLENQKFQVNIQMLNRKLSQTQKQLKRIILHQRKKNYFEKLFDLSSEDDNLNDY